MGQIANGRTSCFRQVEPASESATYREEALKTEATTVLAHVRRATVDEPSHANTHPFRHGPALLVHNGHIPAFDAIRPRLLDRLSDERRDHVRGTTDSEHILAPLLQIRDDAPETPLQAVTRTAIHLIQLWLEREAPATETGPAQIDTDSLAHDDLEDILALNLLWTDDSTLAGSWLNRTLWAVERPGPRRCPLCESPHAHPSDDEPYGAGVLASERITNEEWSKVPNAFVFSVSDSATLQVKLLNTR